MRLKFGFNEWKGFRNNSDKKNLLQIMFLDNSFSNSEKLIQKTLAKASGKSGVDVRQGLQMIYAYIGNLSSPPYGYISRPFEMLESKEYGKQMIANEPCAVTRNNKKSKTTGHSKIYLSSSSSSSSMPLDTDDRSSLESTVFGFFPGPKLVCADCYEALLLLAYLVASEQMLGASGLFHHFCFSSLFSLSLTSLFFSLYRME